MIPRHYALLLALLCAAHLTGCKTSQPHADERPNAGIVPPVAGLGTMASKAAAAPASLSKVAEPTASKPGFFRKLFGAKPSNTMATPAGFRKCKGCQITMVNGNDNKVSQASIGKNKAAAQQASDSATMDVAGENSQLQAAHGNGNELSAKQANPTQEAPGPLAVLADNLTAWVPYVAVGLVVLVVFALWRKKKQAEILLP